MTILEKAILLHWKTVVCRIIEQFCSTGKNFLAAFAVTIGLAGICGQAQADLRPYIVKDDRGGSVKDRLREMRDLRASGRPVEIRGAVCFSTCTMLLGLPQTCISPKTVFGFHGPSRDGRRLKVEEFEYYSQVISQYYPDELKVWYMKKGRKRFFGVHRIKGSEIIEMGIRAC
jgi:hypothetical protein